ncbi:MAG: transposase [Gammaproteobacteria bacterium]|nr:transposase [Gammaproteobacteria bacterium]
MPETFGSWHTTFTRFACWTQAGVWDRVFPPRCLIHLSQPIPNLRQFTTFERHTSKRNLFIIQCAKLVRS